MPPAGFEPAIPASERPQTTRPPGSALSEREMCNCIEPRTTTVDRFISGGANSLNSKVPNVNTSNQNAPIYV